jgi:hypothetical protein
MALTWILTKGSIAQDSSSFVITDNTVYGGSNPSRNQRANVFFCPKTDVNGNRVLQAITPNTSDPTTVSYWTVASGQDGWIEKIVASVSIYTGAAYASAGIVLYYNGVFYKTKSAVPSSTVPPNGTYYTVISAGSLFTNELSNSSIEWVLQDDLMSSRTEDRLRDEHARVETDFIQNKAKYDDYNEADRIDSILNSAYSAMLNQRPQDAELLIRGLENYVISYGAI